MLRLESSRSSLLCLALVMSCSCTSASPAGDPESVDSAGVTDSGGSADSAGATDAADSALDVPALDASDALPSDAGAPDVAPDDSPSPDAPGSIDYGAPGPFTVTKNDATIGGNAVHLLVPSGATPHGAIAFAHGFQLGTKDYDALLGHLASHGWVVVSTDFPGSLFSIDHRSVRDAILAARTSLIAGTIAGVPKIDAARIAASGHSLGGKGAVMALLAEPAFAGAVTFDPVDGSPGPGGGTADAAHPKLVPTETATLHAPIAIFGATQSRCVAASPFPGGSTACAPAGLDAAAFFGGTPTTIPRALWIVEDFGHMQFLDASCGFVCSACVAGKSDVAPRRDVVAALAVAWLERHLAGVSSAQAYLDAKTAAATSAKLLWDGTSAQPACP